MKHRFFSLKPQFILNEHIKLSANESHHVDHVLHLKQGDKITLFNNQLQEAVAHIHTIGPHQVIVKIKSVQKLAVDIPQLVLACAIPKKGKFETIIEKTTELGVNEIIPMLTKRSDVQLKGERALKKLKRYQTVAISAAKQSKRTTVPVIQSIMPFGEALEQLKKRSILVIPSLEGRP